MENIILVMQLISAIGLIALVLIQQGKGAEVGASFGSGASQTIFGSQGSASFISRLTAILAVIFFATTLALGYLAFHKSRPTQIDQLLESVSEPSKHEQKNAGDVPELP